MGRGTRGMVALACALALATGMSGPVEAAKPRPIRQAHACANYMPREYGPPRLWVTPQIGRWYAVDGSSITCWDQMYDDFRPRVRGTFRATVRWYIGKRLVKTERKLVRNTGWDNHVFDFRHRGLRQVSRRGWAVGERRVTARVTFAKRGYRTSRLRVSQFAYPSE